MAQRRALFFSDLALLDRRTIQFVQHYMDPSNQGQFFKKIEEAYIKMVSAGRGAPAVGD